MDVPEHISEIERRLDAVSKRLDDLAERTGQRVEFTPAYRFRGERRRVFWGLAFIAVGLIWLGNRMNWFEFEVPIAAMALILIGAYMIVSSRR